MLTSVIQDEDLLKQAVICYFDPATKDNAAMRQALSYFLPVYCHSRLENMQRMATIAPLVLYALLNLGEELDEGEEMVGISVVGTMLVDWTDARKLVVQDGAAVSWDEAGRKEVKAVNGDVHLDLAAELLERAMSSGCTSKLPIIHVPSSEYGPAIYSMAANATAEEEKKALITMLSKLYITPNSDPTKLEAAKDLAAEAVDSKIATDAPSRNALNKLYTALGKARGENGSAGKSAEGVTVVDTRQDEGLTAAVDNDGAATHVDEEEAEETKIQAAPEGGESLLEELLDDEEEEL